MKVLFFDQQLITDTDIIWGLVESGCELECAEKRVPDAEYTERDVEEILAEIALEDEKGVVDLIATKNFSAACAEACRRCNRLYMSWVHDSPQRALYMKEALYETNRVFVFDRKQYERMKLRGIPYVFHQPLAANTMRMSMPEIAGADDSPFRAEISFVGNLYENEGRKRLLMSLSGPVAAECEGMISAKVGHWGETHTIYTSFSETALSELESLHRDAGLDAYDIPFDFYIQTMLLAQEVAMRDRMEALRRLSAIAPVTLFTTNPQEAGRMLPAVDVRGEVYHDTELPLVFRASKINLNLTSPSIETGIPQRVFEIMSIGGFVLSNAQEELCELFDPDLDIVVFHDFEEMEEKALYYLTHEAQRQRIASRGLQKVSALYDCGKVISRMLNRVEETTGA